MKKKCMALMLSGMMVFTLAGCASNPEKSVVKEKNMDKMLQEAQKTDDTNTFDQIREEVKKYETYKTRIEDKKLKVVVDVDAKVEVPEVEKLSVYRVRAQKIKQDFLERVQKTLTPGMVYYDGSKAKTRTKSDVAKEINDYKKELNDAKKSGDTAMVEEYEDSIAGLKKEYEKAPDKVKLTDHPSQNKILSIKDLYDSNPKDTFYSWLHDLHGDGEMYYGLSDGKDGNYHTLFVQNSDNYGSCLRYESSKNGYSDNLSSAVVENDLQMITPKKDGQEPEFPMVDPGGSISCVGNEPLTLSQEEAEQKVNTLLGQLGLDDYKCYEQGVYSQLLQSGDVTDKYRNVYRFLCLRKLDNVFVNNQAGYKLTDGWQGKDYVKKMWGSEVVAVAVNDNGIVGFHYLSPLSISETVVKDSRIKSFDEIKETFEKMVVIENAAQDKEAGGSVSVKVTDVNLVYTRISEKDSFDTGLVVPVWNFEGTVLDEYGGEKAGKKTGIILSINAIDGSVINQELGY